jgi:hypothetical protein
MRTLSRIFAVALVALVVCGVPRASRSTAVSHPSFADRMLALDRWAAPVLLARQGYSTNRALWLGPAACASSVSANGTGTNGLTTSGASATPVMQAQTDNTSTNTHTYVCSINPGTIVVSSGSTGILAIKDVVFFYGVQTTGLGTQVATLASGTMNSAIVFSTITYPAAGASETPSTVTPVRLDTGSLTIAPAVASFNVATTTAGSFYSVKFTPSAPLPVKTDLTQVLLTVSLLNTATSATITNTPGILIHVIGQ